MRLRQICLVAVRLAPAAEELTQVLGLDVAYRDSGVGVFGLENVVVPVGNDFLEIVAPLKDGTAAGRYLERRRGNGGYMVILQDDDAVAARARLGAMGVRAVWEIDRPDYVATHFHPADTGGVLLSLDSIPGADAATPGSDWAPAGPDWRAAVRTHTTQALVGAELQSDDPAAMAALWSHLLELPVDQSGAAPCIGLDGAILRFVVATDGRGPGLGALDLRARAPAAVLEAAEARGLKRDQDRIEVCGTRINLV